MEHPLNINIVEQLLTGPSLEKDLYHYTSSEGLLGIIQSQTLHCSHIYFMNDYEENLNLWRHFFAYLNKWETREKDAVNFIKVVRNEFKHWAVLSKEKISLDIFEHFKIDDYLLYVLSFSHIEDDLSQWRAYTSNSFGFSLKFNFNENFISQQSSLIDSEVSANYTCKILIKDCVYSTKEKEKILGGLMEYTFKQFKRAGQDWHN